MRVLAFAAPVAVLASLLVCAAGCPKGPCTTNGDCDDGFVCGHGTCTNPCAADLRCSAGQACISRDDGTLEGACLAVTGDLKIDDTCNGDLDCRSGACEAAGDTSVCVDVCDVDTACPDDADRCTLDGLRYVCVPPGGDGANGAACQSSTECTSGQCVTPPGQDQAVCTEVCAADKPCSDDGTTCVRLAGGARACITPLADGTPCTDSSACGGGFCIEDFDGTTKCASTCDGGACADGFSCETKVDSNGDGTVDGDDSPVCMPALDTRADGETCAHARECASGHCASFGDLGTRCASPCASDGTCAAPDVCWTDPSPNGTDVCGPQPP